MSHRKWRAGLGSPAWSGLGRAAKTSKSYAFSGIRRAASLQGRTPFKARDFRQIYRTQLYVFHSMSSHRVNQNRFTESNKILLTSHLRVSEADRTITLPQPIIPAMPRESAVPSARHRYQLWPPMPVLQPVVHSPVLAHGKIHGSLHRPVRSYR